MKKNRSIIFTVLLCCLLSVCALAATACSKKGDIKTNIIGDGDAYEWAYSPAYSDECDADTTIDGKLDEARWDNKVWLAHAEQGVQTRYTTSFSEKGLYIAMQAKDAKMQWNSPRAFMKNSSFYLYVISNKATEYHAFQCYAFYIDEQNSRSRQTARWSAQGRRSTDESGMPTLTAEFFASWDALNYTVDDATGMPETVRFIPQYRHVESVDSAENMFLHPAFASATTNYADVNTAFSFDKNGYKNADADGAELGDAKNGYAKSDGWDFSKIAGDEEGENKSVTSISSSKQAIFFKNIDSSRYSYSVKIKFNELLPEDTYSGMWGVCDMRNTKEFHVVCFDSSDYINSEHKAYRYYMQDYDNTYNKQIGFYNDPRTEDLDYMTLRVIKDDTRYYYIFNDRYENCIELDWLGGKTAPGLFARDSSVTFFDWEAKDYEGADKDAEFAALCDQYMHTVNISSSISGGSVIADKMAMPCDSDQQVHLTVTPQRGFMLTDLTMNGESVFADYLKNMQNGVYSFVPDGSVHIDAVFTELPADKTLRITGKVKRTSGSTVVGLPYAVRCTQSEDNLLYISGATTSAGMFDFTVLRKGEYEIGGRTVAVDGKYTLVFGGEYGEDNPPSIEIDTNDEAFDGVYYAWDDITLDPFRIHNMALSQSDKIQTTHSSYDPSDMFAYYVSGTSVTGSFIIDMDIDAHNDKWPCYGITVEDENNNSVQFFAAGPSSYRRMHGYDGLHYYQADKVATYKEGKIKVRLAYNAPKDEFTFYVNGIPFDTVKRTEYLTGNRFSYGPCGYMSGADGFNTPVTAENPFASFTKPIVTQQSDISVPDGASLTVNGQTVIDGKAPLFADVTVEIPVAAEGKYSITIDGKFVKTTVENGKATATFTATEAAHTVGCLRAYTVDGTITGGDENTQITVTERNNGQVVYTGSGANFTVVLVGGDYIATAVGATKVGKTEFTVNGADTTVIVSLNKEKITGETAQNTPVFDAATGYYTLTETAEYSGYFAEPSVNGDPFLLTATVKQFNESYTYNRVAGFAVQTANGFVRLALVRDQRNNCYAGISDVKGADAIIYELPNDIKNPSGETVNIALAYNGGNYYFFVNGTLAYTVTDYAAPSGKVGLGGTHIGVTFTDWGYSTDATELREHIGATVTAEGFTVKVGNTAVTNGEVLLGDRVTVSMPITAGQNIGLLLDGNAVSAESADGMLTYTFTVTKKTHVVTASLGYTVNGSVTGGDESTEIKIYAQGGGEPMYTGTGATFTAALGNGTYIVTAVGETKVGKAEFTVNGADTTVTVPLDKEKITGATAQNTPVFDAATGYYTFTETAEYSGYFAEPSVNGNPFLLTATVKQFNESYAYNRVAGFAVQTANGFVRLALVRDQRNNCYAGISDVKGADAIIYELPNDIKNPSGETVNIALAYNGGNYYFFVNGTLAYTVTDYAAPSGKVGLGGTHIGVTFTDWGYSTDATELREHIGATVTAEGFTVKVGNTAVTNGEVLLGDRVTVSMPITAGQNIGLLLDGNAVSAESADGMLTYTFTVTQATHTVTYSATYDLTVKTAPGATVSIFAGDSTTPSETGTADASGNYIVALPNGTYKAAARTETKLSVMVSVTVTDAAATVSVTPDKEMLAESVKGTITYDPATGSYKGTSGVESGSYFASELTSTSEFVLTATVKKYETSGTLAKMAGFTVQTENNKFIRLGLAHSHGGYWAYYWDVLDAAGNQATHKDWVQASAAGETIEIALVFKNDTYYFFLNKEYCYHIAVSESYPAPNGKVGLAAAHDVEFTDWAIGDGINEYFATLTFAVTGGTPTKTTVMRAYYYGDVVVLTETYNSTVVLPKGGYNIVVCNDKQNAKINNVTLDSDKTVNVTLSPEIGKAINVTKNDENNESKYNADTGTYTFGDGDEWLAYFTEPTVNAETSFVLTATVNWFNVDSHYAGFAVQTVKKNETDKEFLKFGIYLYPNDGWYGWANYSGDKWSSKLAISDNTPITLALVYNGGNYYLFVNDAHVLTVEVSESYPAPNNKVGLCASNEKTFTDWGYSTDISGYDLTAV